MATNDFENHTFAELLRVFTPPGKDDSQKDTELFLRTVRKIQPEARRPQGFLLSEQCKLPKLPMKKKKIVPQAAAPATRQQEPEEDLFAMAVRNAVPLGGKGRAINPAKARAASAIQGKLTLADYLASKLEFAISSSDEYMEGHVVGLDQMIMGRLRQGQFSPEAHLDMHGQNVEQAFESLQEFMRQAWFKGLHTVLLIPGRGRNSIDGFGILRQKLPYWLTHEPFKRIVLGFCTAQPHDGGPGSIYVLLRKSRKKGPVRWKTMAYDSDE